MSYARRLIHFSGTLVPAAYLVGVLEWSHVRLLLAVAAVAVVVLEVLRLYVGLDWTVFDRLTREYEQDNPAGYALAVVGAALVVLAFPPEVAVPALLVLTIADPIAGILGDVDSVDSRKAWWVMAVTFLVCLAITAPLMPLRAAVPVSVVVVFADAVKPRVFGFVVDDNFSIPVGAGVTGWLALTYLPPLL
ncbi:MULTISPECIES: dolichol kinase [Salinibaculum]|uniref:dolichol kinase n=1 Tax=Salinibaculum TaxID=2732368 RepID=UPI0030CB0DF3